MKNATKTLRLKVSQRILNPGGSLCLCAFVATGRKQIRLLFLLLIGSVFTFLPSFSQLYNFTNYTIEQGLPQSSIYSIFQDSRGYLWVGTESGVARFNGSVFTTFDRSKGLPGNIVRSIVEGPDGNIWVGTDKGIGIYDGTKWKQITASDGLQGSAIIKLAPDSFGRMWASTDDAGVNILSFAGDSILIETINRSNGLSADFVFDILHASGGKTWLALFGGVNMVSFKDGIPIVSNLEDSVSIPSNLITCIDKDASGNLWFGTFDAGAFQLVQKNGGYKVIPFNQQNGLTDTKIWDILCDGAEQVWFGSNENGIYRWNNREMQNISNKNGLPGNLILSIFRDRSRNLWLGSMNMGLSLFQGFHLVHYSSVDGLPGDQVMAVKAGENNSLWVGGNGKGLAKLSFSRDKLMAEYFDASTGFHSKQITSIDFNNEGKLAAGSYGDGLAVLSNGDFNYLTVQDGLADNYINCVYRNQTGSLYIGTNLGFNEVKSNKIYTINEENGLINSEVQTVITDLNGDIWMGTMGGLARFQANTGIYRDFNEEEGLFDLRVHCLVVDKHNQLYIGTSNGLYRYNAELDTIIPFLSNSLNAKTINSLLFYNDSLLIASTTFGFNKIFFNQSLDTIKRVIFYDKSNGFKYSETNINAVCTDASSQVWFGTVNGLTLYRPALEDSITEIPLLHITDIRLSNASTNWNDMGLSVLKWFNVPGDLKLRYNQNHITFNFDGLYLKNSDYVRYKYKLEPLDSGWSPSTKIDSITYDRLTNGNYTFSIISSADDNHWSQPVTYSFIISPPFWKTLWFLLLLSAASIGLLMLYIRYREAKLIKEKEHLEHLVTERTAEVVAQKEQIQLQHKIVTEQKLEITSSITYARRIQQAVLPGLDILAANTSESFVIYKPRDIVSGDFYWIGKNENHLIIAAADCTGHGVPGAFMSMLGISFMNKIIREQKLVKPEIVLGQMRNNVINSLHQGDYVGTTKDGMDMALCVIDLDTLIMSYAGAFNPAVIVSENNALELKANRMPVGYHLEMSDFTAQTVQTKKGDCVYLFTDGFQDQIGGPDSRKFMRKNLRELLVSNHLKSFPEQKQILENTLENWQNNSTFPEVRIEQMDDILVLGFKI